MANYNNIIKRTVQNLLFEGINSKRVIGLAGPTPEEYMDILQNHAKEVYVCDYEPSRPYVEKTSLIGLYQLKNPSWVDADFCSSIIDNWNDILYIWKELQMSKFQTIYFTFNVSLRTGHSHEYTYDWIKKNIMDFNIVNTQTIKGDGKEYIKKHTTDNPDIMLIEYFSTSYMLSVRLKYEWEIDIPVGCKRIIISKPYAVNRDKLVKTICKWYKQGYIPYNYGSNNCYRELISYLNLPTKKQHEVGIKERGSSADTRVYRTIQNLREYLEKYQRFPRECEDKILHRRLYNLRRNPKYLKLIEGLEIEYNCKYNGLKRRNTVYSPIASEFEEFVLKYDKFPEINSSLYKRTKSFISRIRHIDNPRYNNVIKLWDNYKGAGNVRLEFRKYVLKYGKLPKYDTFLYKSILRMITYYKDNSKCKDDPRYTEIVELWNKYKNK